MKRIFLFLFAMTLMVGWAATGFSKTHDGPDPVMHWVLDGRRVNDNAVLAQLGPNAVADGSLAFAGDGKTQMLRLDGKTVLQVAKDFRQLNADLLPKKEITISTWVSVEEGKQWGGVVSLVQDNGNAEKGWVLGYNEKRFYFGLASEGADDGDGDMTYLESEQRFEKGKLYHLVATYDGKTMQLMVNGKLSGSSKAQSGKILYPESAPFVLGGYVDSNEDHRHVGRIAEISIYNVAAKPQWAAKEFSHREALTKLPAVGVGKVEFGFEIDPYLQNAKQTEMTVMWQTSNLANSVVSYGETAKVERSIAKDESVFVHEITIPHLKPETQYFYRVASTNSAGKTITSDVFTFQTASKKNTPFAFAIISDTQGNPKVSGKLASFAWDQRPNFLLHPGDLVSTGTSDSQWTDQFFSSMHPLIRHVPMFPVLGNHEVNARNYYDYMSLPEPEYYYAFKYGNAEFFMLDTNKNVGPGSEQYRWLDSKLKKSKATWKFVCHHHPCFSSDENDYGNLWKTNQSTRGDLRVRKLTALYDRHNVDVVWCGHIHSYERTWCIRNGKVVDSGKGPMYMITGGGGGPLETPGPVRPPFQNNVRRGHHYCMVAINGNDLEFKAYDVENRLFDYLHLKK